MIDFVLVYLKKVVRCHFFNKNNITSDIELRNKEKIMMEKKYETSSDSDENESSDAERRRRVFRR